MHKYLSGCIMNRKKERELAFCLIFEKMFSEEDLEGILQLASLNRDFTVTEYIEKVFYGVYENLSTIDSLIESNLSKKWTVNRITKTSLAILRLAVYEILYMDDIPNGVSVNEAVELTKEYGAENDYAFVNAVLSKVINEKKD